MIDVVIDSSYRLLGLYAVFEQNSMDMWEENRLELLQVNFAHQQYFLNINYVWLKFEKPLSYVWETLSVAYMQPQ